LVSDIDHDYISACCGWATINTVPACQAHKKRRKKWKILKQKK
jgi:hypothetical protein